MLLTDVAKTKNENRVGEQGASMGFAHEQSGDPARRANEPGVQLSKKQRRVHHLIARRRTSKEIAHEMGISTSRVSQYIRTLKTKFGVETLSQLADQYHAEAPPCTNDTSPKNHLPFRALDGQAAGTASAGLFRFHDAAVLDRVAPWEPRQSVRVGPEALDGRGAAGRRLAYIVVVAIGVPAAVVLTLAAMMALSEYFQSFG